jgi:2-methylisocitrate lyase-like PEP mutase family enzyme
MPLLRSLQINVVTAVDPYIPINNREGPLTVDAETAFGQLEEHARLVRGLQQAWTKFSMHIDCGSE